MSFEGAVDYVNALGPPSGLLWLSLPVNAVFSILRQRKRRPGSVPWLAYALLVLWLGQLGACVYALMSGTWYGENGPAPQTAAAEVTLGLALLVAAHIVLLTSARPGLEQPLRPGWPTRHGALGMALVAMLACAMVYVWTLARQEHLRHEALDARFGPKTVYVPPRAPVQVLIGPSPQALQLQQFSPNGRAPMQVRIVPPPPPVQGQQVSPGRPPAQADAPAPAK